DLGALSALGFADLIAPFFAGENVPSAKDSSWLMCPARSSFPSNRDQQVCQTPVQHHSSCRRQHVVKEGKCLGRSFQRAPVTSTHKMPSTQARVGQRGRPPCGDASGSGNRSAIKSHCSSLSCGSGSILDPAEATSASSLRDRSAVIEKLLSRILNKQ